MTKIIRSIGMTFLLPVFCVAISCAVPTRLPGGLSTGQPADESTASVTLTDGDIFIDGTLYQYNPQSVIVADFTEPATASATAFDNQSISTTTLVSGTTTLLLARADYTDIIDPRNVVAKVNFAVGVATTTVTGSLTIVGKNQIGETITETLTITTNTATGNYAYSTITSAAWTITAVSGRVDTDNALLQLGSGTKMGLPANVTAATEILKVIENKALSTTYTLSTTYDTIEFAAAPDGSKHYKVWMRPIKR